MTSSMKNKAKWMHCFCSTESVMKQHYSSCYLSKRLFFFPPRHHLLYCKNSQKNIFWPCSPSPLLFVFFFSETMAFYLPLWCFVVIWNVQWKFQTEEESLRSILSEPSVPTNPHILGILSIRTTTTLKLLF